MTLSIAAIFAFLTQADADSGNVMEWTVGSAKREAIVFAPSQKTDGPVPLIFVFHGHGGTMKAMERNGFHKLWPEAVVVLPQGLPTATARDPEGKRSGWQPSAGDNNDRDLKFVDEMLKTLRKKYKVDDHRIFATGHSNGGGFTYLLGTTRNKEFAALAPVAAGSGALTKNKDLRPLPIIHVAGEKDEIVPFENQKRTMDAVRKFNGCSPDGQPWGKAGDLVGTIYSSKNGAPFVSVIYPGTHKYPEQAPELIVRFFQEMSRPKTKD